MIGSPQSSVVERAFSPPRRWAPLLALADELRHPGVWLQVCRLATERDAGWLQDRLDPGDPLVAAIGACGDPERDSRAAAAVCALTLALGGHLDEWRALKPAADLLGEPEPEDLNRLDPAKQPQLAELVAALRGDLTERVRRISTVVSTGDGAARAGSVTVSIHPERAPGLRLDGPMRLFAPAEPALENAVSAIGRALGNPQAAIRARVEAENAEPGGGDACAAAITAAAEASLGRLRLRDEIVVVGAVSANGGLLPSERPNWDEVRNFLDGVRPEPPTLVAGVGGVKTLAALRRALAAPARRRRLLALAGVVVAGAAVVAALIVPSLGADRNADEAAQQAAQLLPASPLRAALKAAEALSLREDGPGLRAAERVLAASPLTEMTGQEDGHLVAVAIEGSWVTTFSTRGRATRWRLRDDRLVPVRAAEVPLHSNFIGLSRSGRWLLVRPPDTYEQALLIDTTGEHGSRLIAAPDEDNTDYAVGGVERPVVAIADSEGLRIDGGGEAPEFEGNVEALAFSPSGRLLAIAADRRTAVYRRDGDHWSTSRAWEEEAPSVASVEIEQIEVDDQGATLVALDGLGSAVRWHRGDRVGDFEMAEGVGGLAGRSLLLAPDEHELRLLQETPEGAAQATSFPAPVDGATEQRIAASGDGERVIVAGPDGLFSVLDLKRVRLPDGNVVTDSVAVSAARLAVLERVPGGSRLVAWDLRSLAPPVHGPVVPGDARVAVASGNGGLVAATTDRAQIVIRRTSDGQPVGNVRGRGGESWSNVAADRDGSVLAAVDEKRDAVTVWSIKHDGPAKVHGRILFRGPAIERPRPEIPDPLAVSPDGRWLIYGTTTDLWLRDLRSGAVSRLPASDRESIFRVRFSPTGDRVTISTSEGVIELSGPRFRASRRVSESESHDARALHSGGIAAANGFGVQRISAGGPITLYQGVDAKGYGAGTISVSPDGEFVVPHYEAIPLVVLRDSKPTQSVLCALAGGRAVGGRGCEPRAALPEPQSAVGSAQDRGSGFTLSAAGLGRLRLGGPLPLDVAKLPAYSWGSCEERTLPGRAVMVTSHNGTIESISIFQSPYVEEESSILEEVEASTDRGLTASSAWSAREYYGAPADKVQGKPRWWLRRPGGGRSQLVVDLEFESPVPISMAVESPECEGWL